MHIIIQTYHHKKNKLGDCGKTNNPISLAKKMMEKSGILSHLSLLNNNEEKTNFPTNSSTSRIKSLKAFCRLTKIAAHPWQCKTNNHTCNNSFISCFHREGAQAGYLPNPISFVGFLIGRRF